MVEISVVVPAHDASGFVGPCLRALLSDGFAPSEIVLVDDGSRDGTGERARSLGVTVLRHEAAQGPARARNRGVAATDSEVIVFVDADVVVHPGTRDGIVAHFRDAPALGAVFGSYDDRPSAPSVVSRYRNLLHHFVHQRGDPEARTFWTGLGAVRRKVFVELGGLDPGWQAIEDVEFGLRLSRAGWRITLDRTLLGTHLKAWTLGSMLATDLRGRALPWTRLILFRGGPAGDLNLAASHRASAALVLLFGACLLAGALDVRLLAGAGLAAAAFLVVNGRFLRFLARRHGPAFALAAMPYHALHYAAGALGYAWVALVEAPARRLAPRRSARGDRPA